MDLMATGLYRALSGTAPDEEVPDLAFEACREVMVAVNLVIRSLTDNKPR